MEMIREKIVPKSGFTLVELLVAMTLTGIILAAIYSAYMSQKEAYSAQSEASSVQQNLRAALYYMQREIRMAGYDPMGAANVGFLNITANPQSSISFSLDLNENGTYDGGNEYISYRYNSTNETLERQTGGSSWEPVAMKIIGASFTFLDSSGNPTVTPSSVRAVDIILSARDGSHSRQLSTRVLCRNLGL